MSAPVLLTIPATGILSGREALTDSVSAILAASVLAAGWLVLGFRLLRPIREKLGPSEVLALALLIGGGVHGVALFVIGQVSFSSGIVASLALATFAPALDPKERGALAVSFRSLRRPPSLVLFALVPLALLGLLASLARPVGDHGTDGISYHLLGPLGWLRAGRVVPLLDMSTTAFPVTVEALFGAGIALSNERAPGVIGLLLAAAAITQATGLARWLGATDRFATVASLLVAYMPALTGAVTIAFVDLEYAAFALAAVRLLLWEPEKAESRAAFLLGALSLGIALSVKYNGLTLAAITLGIATVFRARREGLQAAARALIAGAMIAAVVGLPVYLRNLLVLGSPIYPPPAALAQFLPGRAFPWQASVDLQNYIAERGRGFGHDLVDLLLLPIRFTYQPAPFHGAGGVGLVPLALLPSLFIEPAIRPLRYAGAWMAANTCVWFVVQQEARFLAPVVILATAATVAGAERLVRVHSKAGWVAFGLAAGISVLYGAGVFAKNLVPVAASTLSSALDSKRWYREVPYAEAFDRLNALYPNCRVLILDRFVTPYYLHCPYIKLRGMFGERPLEGQPLDQARFSSPDAAALDLARSAGVTHVLDVRTAGQPFEFFESLPPDVTETFRSNTARILRLGPEPP